MPKPAYPRDSGYLRWRATNSKKPSPRWRGLGDAPAGLAGKGAGRSVDYTTEPPHLRHVCGTFGPHPRFSLRCRPVILPLIPPMGTASRAFSALAVAARVSWGRGGVPLRRVL